MSPKSHQVAEDIRRKAADSRRLRLKNSSSIHDSLIYVVWAVFYGLPLSALVFMATH